MGDGVLLELPPVVAAVECAIPIQKLFDEEITLPNGPSFPSLIIE